MALATGTALALGAVLGAGKYGADAEAAKRQRKLQGELITYSPWTGIKPESVKDPSLIGDVTQGMAGLGQLQQANMAAQQNQKLTDAAAASLAGGNQSQAIADSQALKYLAAKKYGLGIDTNLGAQDPSQSPWLNMKNPYFLGQE